MPSLEERSTLGAGPVMTAPGIPMIFMGQEFLAGGWFNNTRGLVGENVNVHHVNNAD